MAELDLGAWLAGLGMLVAIVTVTWFASLLRRNASIVDSVWSILFVVAGWTYAATVVAPPGARRTLVLTLVTAWGLRLAGHITWRNWGHGEDPRYQSMRRRQGPTFPVKSLVTVFLLQGLLAWVVSLPLLVGVDGSDDLGVLAGLGVAVWLVGFTFEAVGDVQLARFKADPGTAGAVMDQGLWRYTRHPNYFGDATQWWGLWLIAAEAGGWWTAIGPALMTFLLLRVSGVALLERRMGRSKPAYADYVARTNAFLPGPRR
jgi:steroid 5-alpha reductase family enzyme